MIQTEWQSVYRIKKILKKKCIKFLVILCLFFKSTVDRNGLERVIGKSNKTNCSITSILL